MKISKSYSKTTLRMTGIYAVSFVMFTLASCDRESGKSMLDVQSETAGTYRKYLSDIRCLEKPSFKVLTEHVQQWQIIKDSVFTRLRRDTLNQSHTGLREECYRLHDSICIEFSRLVLSRPRTYQELLSFKGQFSSYNDDNELHHTAEGIRPFFTSLDNYPPYKGDKAQILSAYRALLTKTIQDGIHSRDDLMAYITKEDVLFRAFLTHLHNLGGTHIADITHDTELCCSQIFLAAKRKEITYREAMLYLSMRTNRRQIQNMQTCINDVRNKKISTPSQAHAYIWMLIQPYTLLDGFSMTLLSSEEQKQLDRMAAQTPETFNSLSLLMQSESKRLSELPGMLMEIFIHTL